MAPMRGFPNRLGLPKLTARNQTGGQLAQAEVPHDFGAPRGTGPYFRGPVPDYNGAGWVQHALETRDFRESGVDSPPPSLTGPGRFQLQGNSGPGQFGFMSIPPAMGTADPFARGGAQTLPGRIPSAVGESVMQNLSAPAQQGAIPRSSSDTYLMNKRRGMMAPQAPQAPQGQMSVSPVAPPPQAVPPAPAVPPPGAAPAPESGPVPEWRGAIDAYRANGNVPVRPRLGAADIPAGSKDWMPLAPPGPDDPPRIPFWKTWGGSTYMSQADVDNFWNHPKAPIPPRPPEQPYSPAAVNPNQYTSPVGGPNDSTQFPMISDFAPVSIRGIRGDSPISRMMTPLPDAPPNGSSAWPEDIAAARVQAMREGFMKNYRPPQQVAGGGVSAPPVPSPPPPVSENVPAPRFGRGWGERGQGGTASEIIGTPDAPGWAALPRQPVDGRWAVGGPAMAYGRYNGYAPTGGHAMPDGATGPRPDGWRQGMPPENPNIDVSGIPTQPTIGKDGTGTMMMGGVPRTFVQLPGRRVPTLVPQGASVDWNDDGTPFITDSTGAPHPMYGSSPAIGQSVIRDSSGRLLSEVPKAEWESRKIAARERQAQKLQETMAARSAARLARARGGRPGSVAVSSGVASVAPPSAGAPAGTAAPAPEKPFSYTDSGLWSEVRNKSVEERRKYMRSKGLSFGEIDRLEKQFGEWDAESKKTDNFNRGYNWRW